MEQLVCKMSTNSQTRKALSKDRELATDLTSGAEGRRRQMVLGLHRPTAKCRGKKIALWKGSRGWKTVECSLRALREG